MKRNEIKISKFLSLVLRHKPEVIGLGVDDNGWADVEELIRKANSHGRNIDMETLRMVVETNDKQRFSFSGDRARIRANQGHSIEVDLGLEAVQPPEILFHGTARRFLDAIMRQGLKRGGRQYVHLSGDRETARTVGVRHGKPAIVTVGSQAMHRDGLTFHLSENGVWMTEFVPPKYLTPPPDSSRVSKIAVFG